MKKIREFLSYMINTKIGNKHMFIDLLVVIWLFVGICFSPAVTSFLVIIKLISVLLCLLLVIRMKRNIQSKQKIRDFLEAFDLYTAGMTLLALVSVFTTAIYIQMVNFACLFALLFLGLCCSGMLILSIRIYKYDKKINSLLKELL